MKRFIWNSQKVTEYQTTKFFLHKSVGNPTSASLIKLYMVLNRLLELGTQTSMLFFLLSVFDNLPMILTFTSILRSQKFTCFSGLMISSSFILLHLFLSLLKSKNNYLKNTELRILGKLRFLSAFR